VGKPAAPFFMADADVPVAFSQLHAEETCARTTAVIGLSEPTSGTSNTIAGPSSLRMKTNSSQPPACDLAEYQRLNVGKLTNAYGELVTQGTATGWYNKQNDLRDSAGDFWLMTDEQYLWWTESLDQPVQIELYPTPSHQVARHGPEIMLMAKPCRPWSNKDEKGRPIYLKSIPADLKRYFNLRVKTQSDI